MSADTPGSRSWRGMTHGTVGAGALAIAVLGTFAFAPALSGGWVWDDQVEIVDNALLRDPGGLLKIWLGLAGADYFPLKTSLQWVQWQLWGDNPFPYHVTNLGLHLTSALLVWRLFRRLGCAAVAAWLGGTLFAVHPLTVESVAWIAEFKNAVSLPPLLLATLAYIRFEERRRRSDYFRALLWFVAAALCKTSVVMLPPVLLVYSWWRHGRVARRDIIALAPLFLVSAVLGMVTIWFQQARAIAHWEIDAGSLFERVGRAGAAVIFYLSKAIAPFGLLPVYPRSVPAGDGWTQAAAWLVLVSLVAAGWRWRATWGRAALLGLGWFGLHLAPVLGLVAMAFLHFAWVADHFAYIPLIGVLGLAVAAGGQAVRRWPAIRWPLLAAAALVVGLAVLGTRRHAARFRSEEVLWRYTLERNPAAWVGHNNLAVALARDESFAEAVEQTAKALQLKPDYADAHVNRVRYLAQLGRVDEVLAAAAQAEAQRAATAEMYANVGAALLRAGRGAESLAWYERGLRLDPDDAKTNKGYGVALHLSGRPAAAIEHYERGLTLEPDADTHTNCGVALAGMNRLDEAIRHYEAALRLAPDSVGAHVNFGIALVRSRRLADAQSHFESAVRLDPTHAEARCHLAEVLLAAGQRSEAAVQYRAALRLQPELARARERLEQIEGRAGARP